MTLHDRTDGRLVWLMKAISNDCGGHPVCFLITRPVECNENRIAQTSLGHKNVHVCAMSNYPCQGVDINIKLWHVAVDSHVLDRLQSRTDPQPL